MDINNINELYEDFVDDLNSIPLTSFGTRDQDIDNAINLNNRLVSQMYNIRRYFEYCFEERMSQPSFTNNNNSSVQYQQRSVFNFPTNTVSRNITRFDIIENNSNMMEFFQSMFGMFFDMPHIESSDLEDVKVTISKEDFDKFNKCKITSENLGQFDKECNICIENYKVDDIVITLPCNHFFHKDCIKHWLCDEKVSCPVCRKDVRTQ